MEKLPTLEITSVCSVAGAERVEQPLALLVRGRALHDRRVQVFAELVQLVDVAADDQHLVVRVPVDQRPDHRQLGAGGGRHPVALLGLGRRVRHPLGVGQRHPDLGALGRRDPALRLDVLPRRVVALRADQREHVALAAVLADQGGGQAEPAAGLQVGGEAEDRRRQQVHLVVDDQAPVAGAEQVEVGERAAAPRGEHLVRGDGDRADLLALAGVLADLLLGQRRAGDQLALPLPAGDRVGDQDQRGRLGLRPSPPRRPASCRRRRAAPPRPSRRPRSASTASRWYDRSVQPSSRPARSGAPRRRRTRPGPRPASRA